MQEQQKQLIAKLKDSQNVLVTVSKNPSVDQLAAAIGLTLALNKLDKHATAVFSGQVPSTIEFLKPEDTLEKNTDSLRDFIIALDKSKADKLRYKVENDVVRIFITPYRTSISEKDLDFSQGDFNVDVVVALGVPEQQDLDMAIQSHGRILHDATVVDLSIDGQHELGTININAPDASSLSEMVAALVQELGDKIIDSQIATALLTGIVAMTKRFSNERTTPKTMSISSVLMAAGANQQLIANELDTPAPVSAENVAQEAQPKKEPGTLEIEHQATGQDTPGNTSTPPPFAPPAAADMQPASDTPQIHVDEEGRILNNPAAASVSPADNEPRNELHERILQPPSHGSALTANTKAEGLDESTEELTLPQTDVPMLSHDHTTAPSSPVGDSQPTQPAYTPLEDTIKDEIDSTQETLADIEKDVDSPHIHPEESKPSEPTVSGASNVDSARNAVEAALSGVEDAPDPIAALNAQPLGPELHEDAQPEQQSALAPSSMPPLPTQAMDGDVPGNSPGDQALDMPLPAPTPPPAPSSFPGAAPTNNNDDNTPPQPPVPPVPPPPMPTWGS